MRIANLIAPLVVAAGLAVPSAAEAKRGIALITYGEDVAHLGEVAPENAELVRSLTGADAEVGYYHSEFGLFWLNIWTWGGEYCLYHGDTVWSVDADQAAMMLGSAPGDIRPPWTYRAPPGLLILLGIGGFYGVSLRKSGKRDQAVRAVFEDERYQAAVQIFSDGLKGAPDAEEPDEGAGERAFEAAVQHLIDSGIPREVAEPNLGMVIQTIMSASQEG